MPCSSEERSKTVRSSCYSRHHIVLKMAATRTSPSRAGCLRAMHHAINIELTINFDFGINFEFDINCELTINFEFGINFELTINCELTINFEFCMNFEFGINSS